MDNLTIEVSVSLQQSKDLLRFNETNEDSQGYDVPADRMKSLARLGLIRYLGFSRYEITEVGGLILERLNAKPDTQTLDERLKAAGMFSVAELLTSAPLDRFVTHAGVHDLATFTQWVEMKRAEFLRLQARYDLGEKPPDDLYEWVASHSAAFSEVHVNLKAATSEPRH
jgi:hypothetical protein